VDPHLLINALEKFRDLEPTMSLPSVLAFLYVARRGVCGQKEIEQELRLSNAAASRNIGFWTEFKVYEKAGKDFLFRYEDPMDRRSKLLRLTPEGEAFYKDLTGRNSARA
jgi:DNA-binding MarR family transcriptional regulator